MSSRPTRVLHLIDSLELGGAQTLLLDLLPQLAASGYEITLAALHARRSSLFFERACATGLRVVSLSPYRFWPLYVLRLPLLLWRERFDVVHCHLYASNWFGKPLARWLGVPVVIGHDHCFDAFRFRWPWPVLDAWSARCADLTFVISSALRRRLLEAESLPPARLCLLPNGFRRADDSSPASASARRRDTRGRRHRRARWIGAAGRLVTWKRFDRFLQLAAALRRSRPAYRFVIAGDGPCRRELQATAQELGLAEHVVWTGAVSSLRGFFRQIDAFILTSELEDVPMVLLEAFASGVPAAAVATAERQSQLAEETLLLPVDATPTAWADLLHTRLEDADACGRAREAAYRSLAGRFSLDRQVATMEEAYKRLREGSESRKPETGSRHAGCRLQDS